MINKRFLGKGGIVDYQTSNTAYDKLAFIADHYQDMVKMYDTIMAHLKLPNNEGGGGGCNYLKHTYSGLPVVIKLGDVTKYGYDTSKPDDIEIIRNCLSVSYNNNFTISKPMYVEEFKCTVKQLPTPRGKYLLNLFTENKYSSFLDTYGAACDSFRIYAYGFSTQVSRIKNGIVYDTENNRINSTYSRSIQIPAGNINEVANNLGSSLPNTVKCLVLAKTSIGSINNNDYIVGYSDTLYSDYNSASGYTEELIYKEVTLNNVFIFPCNDANNSYGSNYSGSFTLFSKDRTLVDSVNGTGLFNLIYAESFGGGTSLSCANLLSYRDGLMYTIKGDEYRFDITDNYCTDIVMEYS